jgi:putative transcriptional regulator
MHRHFHPEPLNPEDRRAKAMRFSTLAAICGELDCQPGDILEYVSGEEAGEGEAGEGG